MRNQGKISTILATAIVCAACTKAQTPTASPYSVFFDGQNHPLYSEANSYTQEQIQLLKVQYPLIHTTALNDEQKVILGISNIGTGIENAWYIFLEGSNTVIMVTEENYLNIDTDRLRVLCAMLDNRINEIRALIGTSYAQNVTIRIVLNGTDSIETGSQEAYGVAARIGFGCLELATVVVVGFYDEDIPQTTITILHETTHVLLKKSDMPAMFTEAVTRYIEIRNDVLDLNIYDIHRFYSGNFNGKSLLGSHHQSTNQAGEVVSMPGLGYSAGNLFTIAAERGIDLLGITTDIAKNLSQANGASNTPDILDSLICPDFTNFAILLDSALRDYNVRFIDLIHELHIRNIATYRSLGNAFNDLPRLMISQDPQIVDIAMWSSPVVFGNTNTFENASAFAIPLDLTSSVVRMNVFNEQTMKISILRGNTVVQVASGASIELMPGDILLITYFDPEGITPEGIPAIVESSGTTGIFMYEPDANLGN